MNKDFAVSILLICFSIIFFGSSGALAETSSAIIASELELEAKPVARLEQDIKKEFEIKEKEVIVKEEKTKTPLFAAREADIPVQLTDTKRSSSSDSPWLRMMAGISVVGIMSAVAFLFLRKRKAQAKSREPAPEIKILTQHYIGPKKSLAIIRVAGESILVGITDQNINMIKSLSLLDEDIPQNVPTSFENTLEESEDFSMVGIKDFVSTRLKNMRTI